MADEFVRKLKASHTVLSLEAEQAASKILSVLGWTCYHGAFYRDVRDEKLREADVIARQLWNRLADGIVVDLHLILECKSARDWQLVFAEGQRETRIGHVARVWPGYAENRFEWLHRVLRAYSIPETAFAELRSRFTAQAFPDERALPYSMMPDAPRTPLTVTAFRETNLDKEKELEASVFWRAITALRSATRSLAASAMERHAESFEMAASQTPFSWASFLSDFDHACRESLRRVSIFHPVVLVDSPMWILRNGRLRRISLCRFQQLGPTGTTEWWCDVVSTSEFERFANSVSTYYDRFFRRQGARAM
jgi:hypothetical protein